jgi:hypothetical protein
VNHCAFSQFSAVARPRETGLQIIYLQHLIEIAEHKEVTSGYFGAMATAGTTSASFNAISKAQQGLVVEHSPLSHRA